jgi:ABC-type multidrug transport system fused ATPase/permease subunit
MRQFDLPTDLRTVIDSENVDFAVMGKRKYPRSQSYSAIIFGLIWTAFTSIFVFAILRQIFNNGGFDFINDTASVLFILLFVFVGVSLIGWGFISLTKKGGYFVGTEHRLIQYLDGKIKTTDWEQFTGNMEITNKNGDGDLIFELRTGKIKSGKDSKEFVPDKICISGIPNVFEIEKKCRIRIKENDPTPANRIPEVN